MVAAAVVVVVGGGCVVLVVVVVVVVVAVVVVVVAVTVVVWWWWRLRWWWWRWWRWRWRWWWWRRRCVGVTAPPRPRQVSFVTASADGEVRIWDLSHSRALWSAPAHAGFVRGLTVTPGGARFLSCGDDKLINMWRLGESGLLEDWSGEPDADVGVGGGGGGGGGGPLVDFGTGEPDETGRVRHKKQKRDRGEEASGPLALATWSSKSPLLGIDHHWASPTFATCGTSVDVWDHASSEPVHSFAWGADTVTCVKYNPGESNLLASAGNDRSLCLYDMRSESPMRKVIMAMRANCIAWNPQEPMNFTLGSEDANCYTFDMRNLSIASMVHKDHMSAVMSISYAPTGVEFATGSYDRTVRIFPARAGRSRDVYHTKRMQRWAWLHSRTCGIRGVRMTPPPAGPPPQRFLCQFHGGLALHSVGQR